LELPGQAYLRTRMKLSRHQIELSSNMSNRIMY
jgi:hypothetical protein